MLLKALLRPYTLQIAMLIFSREIQFINDIISHCFILTLMLLNLL